MYVKLLADEACTVYTQWRSRDEECSRAALLIGGYPINEVRYLFIGCGCGCSVFGVRFVNVQCCSR